MKILLINPPTEEFVGYQYKSIPLGLLYLAGYLEDRGDEVKIVDMNNGQQVDDYQPDMIGIGCLFSGRFAPGLQVSIEMKEKHKGVPIVFGGIHPSLFAKEIIDNCPSIDYVVIGEGEETLYKLVHSYNLREIDGLAYRDDGKTMVNPKTQFINNVDDIPYPAFHLLDLDTYAFDMSDWENPKGFPLNAPIPIITSRACPNRCTFCSMHYVHGVGYRPHSPKRVVDEIEYMYRKYDSHFFQIMDDNMTLDKKRIIEICNEITRRGLDIQMNAVNGVAIKTLDDEVVSALVEAGLTRMAIAIESGSKYIRNKCMKKNLTDEQIYKVIEVLKKYPIHLCAFFVIGYPEETHETLEQTRQMIENITPPVNRCHVFCVVPYYGTELFEYCKERDLLTVPIDGLYKRDRFSVFDKGDEVFIKSDTLTKDDLLEFKKAYQT